MLEHILRQHLPMMAKVNEPQQLFSIQAANLVE
jgi:hypothetical protein